MPETRNQVVTYTVESPRFVTTGPSKGTLEAEIAISIDGEELMRKPFNLGGEAMAKFAAASPDSTKSRWEDMSRCLYQAAIEAGLIPK